MERLIRLYKDQGSITEDGALYVDGGVVARGCWSEVGLVG